MGFLRRLFSKKKQDPYEKLFGSKVIYLRSDEEKQTEKEANAGKSLGPEADRLVTELIEIGRSEGFLTLRTRAHFDYKQRHKRTRKIGKILNKMGGMKLMVASCYRVRAKLGATQGRHLEAAWGHIGEWLP